MDMTSQLTIDERVKQIPEDQLRILKEIWSFFLRVQKWPDGVVFRKNEGSSRVKQAVATLSPVFVVHVKNPPSEDYYRLTPAGFFAAEGWNGPTMQLALRYLDYLRELFDKDPRFGQVSSAAVRSALDLDLAQLRILAELFQVGLPPRFATASNLGSFGWSIGFAGSTEDIEELDEAPSSREFLLRKFNASLARAGRQRGAEGTTKVSGIDIFISHSTQDVEIARALVELLRSALDLAPERIRCTSVDGYRLPVGARVEDQLRQETTQAKILVGIITEGSIQCAYVLFELGARWGCDRPLAPLLAGGADSSFLRGPLHSLNALSCDQPAQIHQFISNIANVLRMVPNNPSVYQRHLEALVNASRDRAGSGSTRAAGEAVGATPGINSALEGFRSVKTRMPDLLAEMHQDVSSDESGVVREFIILPNRGAIFYHDRRRFQYFEDQHANLQNKVEILRRYGFVVVVRAGDVPIYSMTEEFVELLSREP